MVVTAAKKLLEKWAAWWAKGLSVAVAMQARAVVVVAVPSQCSEKAALLEMVARLGKVEAPALQRWWLCQPYQFPW